MGAGKNIEHTNAIAVFAVFMFFLIVSFGLETFFHKLHHYFEHHNQHGLLTALEKVKDELMLMGFCSLILIVFEPEIMMICTDMRTIRAVPAQVWHKCPCANLYMHQKYKYLMEVDITYFSENGYDEKLSGARFEDMNGETVHADGGLKPDGYNYTDLAKFCCDTYPKSCIPGCKPMEGCKHEYLSSSSGSGSASSSTAAAPSPAGGSGGGRRLFAPDGVFSDFAARRNLKQVQMNTCPDGQAQFIEQQALHQTHTIIFYIAMMHIVLGVVLLSATTWRVKKWTHWEKFGDTDDEKVEDLDIPKDRKGLNRIICGSKELFTDSVDAAGYIAIRRYYIARNCDENSVDHHPETYPFVKVVKSHMTNVTGEMLGIEWWMWLTLGIQILLEGYGFGTLNVFTMFAFFTMILAGTKLQLVLDLLTRHVYSAHGCLGSTEEEISAAGGKGFVTDANLQKMISSLDFQLLDNVEPDFWFNHPSIVSSMIKFCLWQNSVSLVLFFYFGIKYEQFDQMHTCFWESRTLLGTLPDAFIILFTLVLSGSRVLPVYSLVSLTTEHFHEKGMLIDLLHDWSSHGHSGAAKIKGKERAEEFAHEKAHEIEGRRQGNTVVVPIDGSSSSSSKEVEEGEEEAETQSREEVEEDKEEEEEEEEETENTEEEGEEGEGNGEER
jgi:hypothetical protein